MFSALSPGALSRYPGTYLSQEQPLVMSGRYDSFVKIFIFENHITSQRPL